MGQFASKAAGRAAATAATRAKATPGVPPAPASNVSASAAAVEASSRVRNPTFDTPASAQDLEQQQVLRKHQQQAPSSPPSSTDQPQSPPEMPQDLLDFLNQAGPVHKQEQQRPKVATPRLPRQPWQGTTAEQPPPNTQSKPSQRRQEAMPLAERIEGFEVSKSTSFSRSQQEVNPKIYQKGTTLDMYHLLSQKPVPKLPASTTAEAATTSPPPPSGPAVQRMIEETYQAYGSEFALPDDPVVQAQHKQLLENTLRYLDLPVIMKDVQDNPESYDGVHPAAVPVYETMKLTILPKNRVRLVLEDLYEREQEEEAS